MGTVLLRNTNPLGQVDLPLIGRQEGSDLPTLGEHGVGCLEPGEVFEIDETLAGHAPHWRRLEPGDDVAALATRDSGELDDDDQPLLEVYDPGAGLLAQVGNYELVED